MPHQRLWAAARSLLSRSRSALLASFCAVALLFAVPAEARPRDPFAAFVAGIGKAFAASDRPRSRAVKRKGGIVKEIAVPSMPSIAVHPWPKPEAARANPSGLTVLPDKGALRDLVAIYAGRHGIAPKVALALVQAESDFDPWATGGAGEIGLGQIKCATARDIGYEGSCRLLYSVGANLHYSMKYLAEAQRRSDGTLCGMLSLYNAGIWSGARRPGYCRRVLAAMS